MRGFSILVPAAVCLGVLAFAANLGQVDIPFNTSFLNPCNGELVDFTGNVHFDSTLTVNGNNAHITTHANAAGITGVGRRPALLTTAPE